VDLKLHTVVDTEICSYSLSLSFKPDPTYPLLNDVTAESFLGMEASKFDAICAAEGFYENAEPLILSTEEHVGLNNLYTNFAYGIEISKRATESIGFKLVTLGASPCGVFLLPFPQYSIHFYTMNVEERKELKCVSEGGYFCKSYEKQCSDAGRKMNMNGADLPTCPDAPPGPPLYQNVPAGFFWTLDGNALNGVNAATPSMGLHGIDPSEFSPTRDTSLPFTLMLNHDKEVVGNHVLFWSGFALGEAHQDFNPYVKDTPSYNCQTEDKAFMPTRTEVKYDEDTMRTSVTVTGPLLDCSGPSYTEIEDSKIKKRSAKSSKSSKNRLR